MWIKLIACGYLGICAVCDSMKKQIPLVVVWAGMLTAIVLRMMGILETSSWTALGMSLLPGIFFWILGFVTKEQVGYGDGWLLLMIGLFYGYEDCFVILLMGLVLESVTALLLLVFHKIRREDELAFAPFLFLATAFVVTAAA